MEERKPVGRENLITFHTVAIKKKSSREVRKKANMQRGGGIVTGGIWVQTIATAMTEGTAGGGGGEGNKKEH